MSDAVAPAYTLAASLRWFGIVYSVALLGVAVVVGVAATYGVTVPTTGLSIGLFAGVVVAAGQRYARKRGGWTGRERTHLAIGYTAIAVVVSVILFALVLVIDVAARAMIADMLDQVGLLLLGIFAVAVLIYFGLARFALAMIARRRAS